MTLYSIILSLQTANSAMKTAVDRVLSTVQLVHVIVSLCVHVLVQLCVCVCVTFVNNIM